MKKEIFTLSFAFLLISSSSFFWGYKSKTEQVESIITYDRDIYAIDKEGLLRDLEEAYILYNFETNSLVVLDENHMYEFNKEAKEKGAEMTDLYRQLIENNRVELITKEWGNDEK